MFLDIAKSRRVTPLGIEVVETAETATQRVCREAVSRGGRIQSGCIPVAAGPATPVRLVNRLPARCVLIRASDFTVHPYVQPE